MIWFWAWRRSIYQQPYGIVSESKLAKQEVTRRKRRKNAAMDENLRFWAFFGEDESVSQKVPEVRTRERST